MPGTLLIGDWKKSVEDELTNFASGLQQKFQVIGDTPPAAPPAPDPGIILQQLQGHAEQVAQRAGDAIAHTQQVGKQLHDYASGLITLPQADETPPATAPNSSAASDYRSQVPAAARRELPAGASVPGWLQDLIQRNAPEDLKNDPEFIRTVAAGAKAESGWDVNSVQRGYQLGSGGGARGLFQFDMGGMGSSFKGREQELLGEKGAELQARDIVPLYAKAYRSAPRELTGAEKASWVAAQAERPQGYTDPSSAARRGYANAFGEIATGVGGAVQAAGRAVAGPVGQAIEAGGKQISQFGDAQLTNSEAYAACGPAAAVRFAQRLGRNPTLREALDLAKDVGWTQQQGMAGISSQQRLMDKLGVATKLVPGAAWDQFAREAQSGNPVTISTSAHYFYADGYDPGSGAFHVGRSGTDLRGGKEWMTRAEIESAAQRLGGGNVQGALFADNPSVPATSQAVGGTTGTGAPLIAAGDETTEPARKPLQIIGDAPRGEVLQAKQVGQAFSDLGTQVQERTSGFTPPTFEGVGDTVAKAASDFTAPGGALEEITKPRLTGIGDALAPVGEAFANAPVLGGALGLARGPLLLSDQELLQQATPSQRDNAREYAKLFTPDPTDEDIADALRGFQVGTAYAGERVGKAATGIDYDALARMRRQARGTQPEMPGMPTPEESRLNKEIAASVNNIFAVPSLFTNTIGGAVETVKRPVVTAVSGNLGAAGADLRGMGLALGDALADFGTTFRTGNRPSRTAAPDIGKGEAFLGKDVFTSEATRVGFLRAMSATDEFYRHVNSAGQQASEMVRLMKENPTLSQAEVLERFKDDIFKSGEHAAAQSVYATGGSGIGEKMAGLRAKVGDPTATPLERGIGALTNVLVPFSSVPDVILTQGLKRLPGINEAVLIGELRSKDPATRQRAVASAALAETINAAILVQSLEGNITGNGPSDPDRKQTLMRARDENGDPLWQPNSVRIGNRWVPYSSLGPVAVRMGAIANAVEQIDEESKKANPTDSVLDRVATTTGNALAGTGETIADAWYLQTVGRLFDALKKGDPGSFLGQQALATGMRAVPYAGELRNIEQFVAPATSEPRGPVESVAARLPGLSELATPRIDPATGRPILEPRDPTSLIMKTAGPGEPSPVNMALAEHNLSVGDAPPTVTIGSGRNALTVPITEDEQRRFQEIAGPEIERTVLEFARDPVFGTFPREERRALLQKAIGDARHIAGLELADTLSDAEIDRRLALYEEAKRRQAEPSVRLP